MSFVIKDVESLITATREAVIDKENLELESSIDRTEEFANSIFQFLHTLNSLSRCTISFTHIHIPLKTGVVNEYVNICLAQVL